MRQCLHAYGNASLGDLLGAKAHGVGETKGGGIGNVGVAQTTHNGATDERYFTRTEVAAIVRAEKARWRNETSEVGGIRYRAALEALDEVLGVVERME